MSDIVFVKTNLECTECSGKGIDRSGQSCKFCKDGKYLIGIPAKENPRPELIMIPSGRRILDVDALPSNI